MLSHLYLLSIILIYIILSYNLSGKRVQANVFAKYNQTLNNFYLIVPYPKSFLNSVISLDLSSLFGRQ